MCWLLIGAIFVIGWVLAFTGVLCVARDLGEEPDEPARLPPSAGSLEQR
jgi:hypothetical protein